MDKETVKKVLRLRNEIIKKLAEQQKEINKDKKLFNNNKTLAFLEGRESQIQLTLYILDEVMGLKNIIEVLK